MDRSGSLFAVCGWLKPFAEVESCWLFAVTITVCFSQQTVRLHLFFLGFSFDRPLSVKAIQKNKGTAEVTLNQYLNDIHTGSHSNCFVLKLGKVYQISDRYIIPGVNLVKIRDSSSDLYRWIAAANLEIIDKNQTAIKASYFKSILVDSQEACFDISPFKRFLVTDTRESQGHFMVEIHDRINNVFLWLPLERTELVDQKLAALCNPPDAPPPDNKAIAFPAK